ncbi:ATP-binding protein [Thiotrichales bacterium HSG1]|nr:ATP-binding protein [Thiotrichales bacterium HSG1]
MILILIKKDFINLQTEKHDLKKQLAKKSTELSDLLTQLTKTEQKLIQTEKIAILGKEMAGITHEINTPLGVISSSISNIRVFLEQLPVLFDMSCNKSDLIILLKRSSQSLLSSKEERKLRRNLVKQLVNVDDPEFVANHLVNMGIYGDIEDILPILQSPDKSKIIEIAYKISTLQSGVTNISIAIDKVIKIATAVNVYGNNSNKKIAVNIIDGIENTLLLYRNKTKLGINIIRDYSELPDVICYPDKLCQVWANLIHNALQAMDYKGELQIEARLQDSNICVNISDNGIGIPTDIQAKIFEPYFTTKSTGNGLGLDIVKHIIDKHDGMITVVSKPGQTLFSVSIPI